MWLGVYMIIFQILAMFAMTQLYSVYVYKIMYKPENVNVLKCKKSGNYL